MFFNNKNLFVIKKMYYNLLMSLFFSGIKLVFKRKDSLVVFLLTLFIVSVFFFIWQNGGSAIDVFNFNHLSASDQIKLFISTLFDTNVFNEGLLRVLVILVSIVSAFNLALIYLYFKERQEVLVKSKIGSGLGLFLAIVGTHCVSCGFVFFQIALSTIGLGFVMQYLPLGGLEIGFVGLIIITINTYSLAKKVVNPYVC